jgi:inosine-uridine nucleoside N-ribohydrolase
VRKEGTHVADWNYTHPLAERFPYHWDQETAPEATALYRKLLSAQPDTSVILVTVGPMKNIENLLRSGPDRYAPLTGVQLVQQKVSEAVIMGGEFPAGSNEWNFDGDMPGVTRFVLEHLPVPVTFSGYEVGVQIKTGAVFNQLPADHPLYVGFMHFSQYAPWRIHAFQPVRTLDEGTVQGTDPEQFHL